MNPLDLRWQMLRDRWPLRLKQSGTDVIPPFSIVLVSSVAVTNNELVYTIRKPNASSTDFNWNQYLVTGPFSIGGTSGNEGLGTDLKEPGLVRYDTGTPAAGEIWGAKHDQHTLSKNYYGFECLGGNTTAAGNNVAVFRWVGINEVLGKADAAIANAASGTVSVWASAAAGSESDITANLSTCYNRGRYIYSGEFVRVRRIAGNHYVTPASESQLLRGQTDAAISKGSSGTVSVYTDGGSDTTDNITATNIVADITASGKNVFCQWCNGTYFITQCECPL